MRDISKQDIVVFVEKASLHHATMNSRPKYLTLRDDAFRHGCIHKHKIQRKNCP